MRPDSLVLVALIATSCAGTTEPANPEPADARVKAVADEYVAGFFDRFPEQPTYYSLKDRPHDRLTDLSPAAQKMWEAKEDQWLAGVKAIDPLAIQSAS